MSIADKEQVISANNVIIAENEKKVYEAGYNKGKAEGGVDIDESKIIEKTATGTGVVALDDVSSLFHNISVQLMGDNVAGKQIKVYGRNLFDNDTNKIKQVIYRGPTTTYTRTGYEIHLPNGTYVIHTTLQDGKTSGDYIYGNVVDENNQIVSSANTFVETNSNAGTKPVVFDIKDGYMLLIYNGIAGVSISSTQKLFAKYDIQIESGTETFFEPYIAPTTYNADENGKVEGIKSLSPCMTIVCEDTDISVSYCADWGIVTEREKMWNGVTQDGKRRNYTNGFAYGFGNGTFRPHTDLIVSNGSQMFLSSNIANLAGSFKKYDTKFDTSKATTLYYAFSSSFISRIPEISLEGITSTTGSDYVFASGNIERIEKLIFKEDGTTLISANMFKSAANLKEIRIGGVIGGNINFKDSPLDRESTDNIFEHLKDFTVWTETTNTAWREDEGYPTKIKVVLNEGITNPENCSIIYIEGDNTGQGTQTNFFNENGEFITIGFVMKDNSGFFQIDNVIDSNRNTLTIGTDYNIYTGSLPSTSKTITFNAKAVKNAYTDSEWNGKVYDANKNGWTVETV